MIVADVPARDWMLYFNNVYMLYDGDIALVNPVQHNGRSTLQTQRATDGKTNYLWRKADLRKLEIWWPRAGAYNLNGHAAYIARKANRCMRKSCCPRTHYYIKWGNRGLNPSSYILNGPNHLSWDKAKEVLDKRVASDVAVCRDMIVTRVKDGEYKIIYRGEDAGVVNHGEYTAANDFSPTTKLVYRRLVEEGIV